MASQRRGFAPGLQKICRSPRINQGYVRAEMASLLYGDGCFPRREWQQPQKDGSGRGRHDFVPTRGTVLLRILTAGASKWGTPQVRGTWQTHPPQLEGHLLKLVFIPPTGRGACTGQVLPSCASSLLSAALGHQHSPLFFLPFPWQTLTEEQRGGCVIRMT